MESHQMILYIHSEKEILMNPENVFFLLECCVYHKEVGEDEYGNKRFQILAQKICLEEDVINELLGMFDDGIAEPLMLHYSQMGTEDVYLNWY